MIGAAEGAAKLVPLFAFERVFQTTNGVLNFARDLLCLAVSLQFGIAGNFADSFFHLACDDFCRSGDAVFIHDLMLSIAGCGLE